MNLSGRGPLGLKQERPAPDPAHLARVRGLGCCICEAYGLPQSTPTEAHHPICERYSTERVPDAEAIPLCAAHHRTGEDGYLAIHVHRAAWVSAYGSDRDWIAGTQDRIKKEAVRL